MQISKKLATIVASGIATVSIAGGAFAYFTATGSATGATTLGTASPWLVSGVTASGGAMNPAGFQQRVDYSVKNTSTGTQNLGSVVVSVANNGSGDPLSVLGHPGCLVSWFDIQQRPYPAEPAAIHSITLGDYTSGTTHTGSSLIQMNNGGSVNQDACQGISLPLVVSAS
jgi:hypothetical protein